MKTIPLATQFLYEFSIDPNLTDRALEYFLSLELVPRKSVLEVQNATEGLGLDDPTDKSKSCLYHKELFDELQKCVDQVSEKHFKDTKLAICDSWMTRSKFGQTSDFHYHAYSLFSGLLYMTDQQKSETIFYLPDPYHARLNVIFGPDMKEIPYKFNIKPEKGKLIIWDSSLNHKIGTLAEKNIRYTLAFNTWPTGVIGKNFTGKLKADVVDVSQLSQKD